MSRTIIIAAMAAALICAAACAPKKKDSSNKDNQSTTDMSTLNVPAVGGFADLDKFAKTCIASVNWPDAFPYAPEVKLAVAHTSDRLLIRFDVTEDNPKAVTTENNGPVWEDSCCEFFVSIPGQPGYFNFETNCIAAGLAAKRTSREDCVHFDDEKMAKVIRRSSLGNQPIDIKEATSWYLELEVPFEVLGLDACPDTLNANFYKCGDKTDKPHYISWNKIDNPKPNFHLPEFFGTLILEK